MDSSRQNSRGPDVLGPAGARRREESADEGEEDEEWAAILASSASSLSFLNISWCFLEGERSR